MAAEAARVLDGFEKGNGFFKNELETVIGHGAQIVGALVALPFGSPALKLEQRTATFAQLDFSIPRTTTLRSQLPAGREGLGTLLRLDPKQDARWSGEISGRIYYPDAQWARVGVAARLEVLVEARGASGAWRPAALDATTVDGVEGRLVSRLMASYPKWLSDRYHAHVTPKGF